MINGFWTIDGIAVSFCFDGSWCDHCAGNEGFCWVFRGEMYLNLNRTEKNRKKPVETEEIWLTKRLERMKVNCGTVLRTRMNIDDFALKKRMRFTEYLCR
jgi:hypothetical protein